MIINAELHCKAYEFRPTQCEIVKIIELPRREFMSFMDNPTQYSDLIVENKHLMREKNGVNQCLLALCEGGSDGILFQAEGYDYARYSGFLPNARQIVSMEQSHNQNEGHTREKEVSGTKPLPFTPERMEQLFNNALGFAGDLWSEYELYDTLSESFGMTDEEISASGFGWLKEYYTGQAESEDSSMKMT